MDICKNRGHVHFMRRKKRVYAKIDLCRVVNFDDKVHSEEVKLSKSKGNMLKPTSGILDGLVHFLERGLILLLHPAQQRLVHRPLQVLG
jgi:hypothetical protein